MSQSFKAQVVAFYRFDLVIASKSPISIHDKGYVLWDGSLPDSC